MVASVLYIITVDAKQVYCQVTIYKLHKEKLAFFAPNYKKYTFKVMTFGPMKTPSFYTSIAGKSMIYYDVLFR